MELKKMDTTQPCDGACNTHADDKYSVHVEGWGLFCYCSNAIAEDISRGYRVFVETEGID